MYPRSGGEKDTYLETLLLRVEVIELVCTKG